jgi:uncharacterized membrane protein
MPSVSVRSPRAIRIGALLFTVAVFVISWWHWWTFQYGTFDLAFYVQSLWLALRGEWHVSLLNVPLMGNHAEPLVFLLVPFFAIWPHPMLFVLVQTLALASMAFTGFRIARHLGYEENAAVCLGLVTLLLPATTSIGIYEFHPEAFAAPLLLLLIEARLAERYGRFWLWFLAVLACKENMALLLATFCAVFALMDWRRGRGWLWRWNLAPCVAASVWLVICAKVISPWLNAGNVDYLGLYSHLGGSGGEIVRNFLVEPHRAVAAIRRALTQGDLVWSLLLPLLCLPLLRPHWLLIASPILLQHLLSWRFTEWSLGTHYAAPLLPLFWIAAVEGLRKAGRGQSAGAWALAGICAIAHLRFGPARELASEAPRVAELLEERERKAELLAGIPQDASVTAVQPFLSHVAKRADLHSLHHVLKGLKTLSADRYEPPAATDVVLIDYADSSTFSTLGGFYHPQSRPGAPAFVPSSDRLLHEFLRTKSWQVRSRNSLALFTAGPPLAPGIPQPPPARLDDQTTLASVQIARGWPGALQVHLTWSFGADRQRFPWMMLVLVDGHRVFPFLKGACAPEAGEGLYEEWWNVVFPSSVPPGRYEVFAVIYDGNEAAWKGKLPPHDATFVWLKRSLGTFEITPAGTGDAPEAR